jgi:hypothetical protein
VEVTACYAVCTKDVSPGVTHAEREGDHSVPFDDEVKNAWNGVKYRDNIAILLKALKQND